MLRFLPQKNKYVPEESEFTFSADLPVPQHLAIIMDGNGRWALIDVCLEWRVIKKEWRLSKK